MVSCRRRLGVSGVFAGAKHRKDDAAWQIKIRVQSCPGPPRGREDLGSTSLAAYSVTNQSIHQCVRTPDTSPAAIIAFHTCVNRIVTREIASNQLATDSVLCFADVEGKVSPIENRNQRFWNLHHLNGSSQTRADLLCPTIYHPSHPST